MGYGGLGRGPPPAQLEQQFQARIAQAKEAARLASIAAAARAQSASNAPPFAQGPAVPGVPFRPPPRFSPAPEPAAMGNIPPDVRNRIDRLVEFVARNGDAFEATAKQRERDNPDFAFLEPGGPYSDYYQWKKKQMCGAHPSSVAGVARSPPPRPPLGSPNGAPLGSADPLGGMSVGAMANVCKFARASGVQVYAPIPGEVIRGVASLSAVEPARLEIRLSEFYRDREEKHRREAGL